MTQVTFKGSPVQTVGELPGIGSDAPDFTLAKQDLSETVLPDYSGQKLVLNIFPSIDTPVCALSVMAFNEKAAGIDNTTVLCVSVDLPFAQARFCGAEGIENVETASAFRSNFGEHYGVTIAEGPLAGLLARAVVVIDEAGQVIYTELVPEIAQEPDYAAALAAIQ
ncbi:MAG: thiol peroxidase [Kiritimatiellales bacterium]|nr:thiol peroxidase [Kiritimatiellales bacterium]